MRLALYQPDIPQNVGTLMRLSACLAIPLDIIEPCGFLLSDKKLKRSGMDYIEGAEVQRHISWQRYRQTHQGRLIALVPRRGVNFLHFSFLPTDSLLLGQESCGLPEDVIQSCDAIVWIPMTEGKRSLNVAISGAMVVGEALRQTHLYPSST